MKIIIKAVSLIALLFIVGCKNESKTTEKKTEITLETKEIVPDSWVANRVAKAKERLAGSEAGKIVWQAMEAHGGLYKWYSNGALSFRFNYQPLDGSTVRDSYQVVDVWNNRALHTSTTDKDAKFGWDGSTAWVQAKDSTAFAYDTKFWALTPLYLFGHPFILDGEGVNLELLPETSYKGKVNDVVKVTFEAGTGDAPDDYYILQFDKESHLLTATRYIVSYPKYFKDGGHNPEKFMEVGELVNVSGVLLPNGLKTHWTLENQQQGEYITKIEITDIKYVQNLKDGYFEAPEGAKIISK
ncbi:hypothetical protein JQC67_08705 [Aurantibacter crassamenti]|uniref:hypothetical protein n=1 Tax=Aurantibacter crassamenti TaxID=1837375 RepID=UPI00193ABEF8|nr:hypothetical protein [Aurantibacter crassamenti]MBM1106213.1 hypothetical protein [Aurantibacter crassamenti]